MECLCVPGLRPQYFDYAWLYLYTKHSNILIYRYLQKEVIPKILNYWKEHCHSVFLTAACAVKKIKKQNHNLIASLGR